MTVPENSVMDFWINNNASVEGNKDADYDKALASMEENIPILREKLDDIKENGTGVEAMEFAIEIISMQEYQDAIAAKEHARYARKEYAEKKSEVNELLDKYITYNYNVDDFIKKGKFPEDFDPNAIYEYGQKALLLNERFIGFSEIAEKYKNIVADALFFSFNNRDNSDVIKDYEGSSIGNMVKIGEFEPGSREWLELRQTGAGASDVGTLVAKRIQRFENDEVITEEKFDKKLGKTIKNLPKDENRRESLEAFHASKVEKISDEQVEEQTRGQFEFTDASSRGNALEAFIAELYARSNDCIVLHNKGTWNNPGSIVNVNIDGLLTSDGENPDGILEIKTATDPTNWGPTYLGINGVPLNYRAQVLAATYEAGFDRGAVAVLINETEFRYYNFNMTPELREEAAQNYACVSSVMEKIFEIKAEALKNPDLAPLTLAYDPTIYGEAPLAGPRLKDPLKVFPKSMLTTGLGGDKGRFFTVISRYRGVDVEDVIEDYKEIDSETVINAKTIDKINPATLPAFIRDGEREEWIQRKIIYNLVQLFYESDISDQTFTGIDIETNSFSGTMGRIIEIGITSVDMGTGEEKSSYSQLYNIPEASKRSYGTGAEDVHNISIEDIDNEIYFDDEEEQKRVLNKLLENKIVFAHNAGFEKQFLRSQLKGFAQAEYDGDIYVMDTMDFIKKTMPTANNNKLEEFCRNNGVEYVDAHRALQDAQMMMKALYNYQHMHGGEVIFD